MQGLPSKRSQIATLGFERHGADDQPRDDSGRWTDGGGGGGSGSDGGAAKGDVGAIDNPRDIKDSMNADVLKGIDLKWMWAEHGEDPAKFAQAILAATGISAKGKLPPIEIKDFKGAGGYCNSKTGQVGIDPRYAEALKNGPTDEMFDRAVAVVIHEGVHASGFNAGNWGGKTKDEQSKEEGVTDAIAQITVRMMGKDVAMAYDDDILRVMRIGYRDGTKSPSGMREFLKSYQGKAGIQRDMHLDTKRGDDSTKFYRSLGVNVGSKAWRDFMGPQGGGSFAMANAALDWAAGKDERPHAEKINNELKDLEGYM